MHGVMLPMNISVSMEELGLPTLRDTGNKADEGETLLYLL